MEIVTIDIESTDPILNLEIEEQILSECKDDQIVLRFWRNTPCVILGRFQNESYEVCKQYVEKENIPVLRRFTGGGTVYHDLGNLNVSFFIRSEEIKKLSDQKGTNYFSSIIYDALKKEGVEPRWDTKRNAMYIGDKKFLGSASILTGGTLLFHCSVLVSANLHTLNSSLLQKPNYIESKKPLVQSVRDHVINLSSVDTSFDLPKIKGIIASELYNRFPLSNYRQIVTTQDLHKIKA